MNENSSRYRRPKTHECYPVLVTECAEALGSWRALHRQLGLGHSTLQYRINNPHVVRREHVLAITELHNRIWFSPSAPESDLSSALVPPFNSDSQT